MSTHAKLSNAALITEALQRASAFHSPGSALARELAVRLQLAEDDIQRRARMMRITLQDFRAWVVTKPPEEQYIYMSLSNCPVAQYLRSRGWTNINVGATRYIVDGLRFSLLDEIDIATRRLPHTFGDLQNRLTQPQG